MFKYIRQAPTPPPPPSAAAGGRWSSDEFVARIEGLVDQGRGEEALDFFLSQVGELAASGLHRRAKLDHLRFLGRLLEAKTASKHGPDKLARKALMIGDAMETLGLEAHGTFLDFGCGRHDPLALAAAAYANGFERGVACDLQPVEVPAFSALSMYDILLEFTRFPSRFLLPGGDEKDFQRRVKPFAPRIFAKRDFEGGIERLAGKVDYRIAELTSLDIEDGELGFAVSIATLEHVEDPAAIYGWLFRKARPGSGQFHYIDLSDHRAYVATSGHDPWSFLTTETGPQNVNRLRASEHRELVRQAGFEIVGEEAVRQEMPRETRARLIAPWRDLSIEELETIGLRLLLRRPA